jgi:hypothetical protein
MFASKFEQVDPSINPKKKFVEYCGISAGLVYEKFRNVLYDCYFDHIRPLVRVKVDNIFKRSLPDRLNSFDNTSDDSSVALSRLDVTYVSKNDNNGGMTPVLGDVS